MKNMFDPLEGGGGGKLASADFSGPTTSRLRATLNRWCLSFWNLISRHRLVLERETFRRRRSCFSFPRSRTQVSLEPSDSDKFRFETSKSRWKATYLLHYFQNFISASLLRESGNLSLIHRLYDTTRTVYNTQEMNWRSWEKWSRLRYDTRSQKAKERRLFVFHSLGICVRL